MTFFITRKHISENVKLFVYSIVLLLVLKTSSLGPQIQSLWLVETGILQSNNRIVKLRYQVHNLLCKHTSCLCKPIKTRRFKTLKMAVEVKHAVDVVPT